jgi:bacteriocin biosynthesis cyclodehydratase domain-containing protein
VTTHARDRDPAPAGRADCRHREGRLGPSVQAPGDETRRLNTDEGRRRRLRPTVEVFPASDGHLYLLAGEDRHLRIRNPTPAQVEIIGALDGSSDTEVLQLVRARGHDVALEDVRSVVTELKAAGVVEDAADDSRSGLTAEDLERYDRQLRYFGDLELGRPRAALQRQLCDAHVAILGLGGLGSWALQALACVGVGRITAVDFDHVDLSNLSRQSIYRMEDIGRLKVDCAAEWLTAFAPSVQFARRPIRLTGPHLIADVVRDADLVLGLVDSPVGQIESWINQACRRESVALLSASQFPPVVRVGPMYLPDRPGCHACLISRVRDDFPMFDELAAWRRKFPSPAATFGPASALIGSLLANEAVNFLARICAPTTSNCCVLMDLRTLEMQREPVLPHPECEVCSVPTPRAPLRSHGAPFESPLGARA